MSLKLKAILEDRSCGCGVICCVLSGGESEIDDADVKEAGLCEVAELLNVQGRTKQIASLWRHD
jgi:hypothetical protein